MTNIDSVLAEVLLSGKHPFREFKCKVLSFTWILPAAVSSAAPGEKKKSDDTVNAASEDMKSNHIQVMWSSENV